MSGLRIGGAAALPPTCSPPVGAYEGSGRGGWQQVWRACSNDAPGDLTQITDFVDGNTIDQCSNPVLSPDGTKILFEGNSAITGYREIWLVDAVAGSTAVQLVADASNYRIHFAWHPDSDQFLYVAPVGGTLNGGLILLDSVSAIGSPTTLRTPTAGWSCYRPHFNYDGSRIAYIMDKDSGAGCDLRVMDADGSNDAAVDTTLAGYRFNQPTQHSWAWGSNQLVYEIGNSPGDCFVIQDDGSGKTQVNANGPAAGGSARISEFAWAPNDGYVIFTANLGNGFYDIIRGELDGSTTTRLNTSHGAVNVTWFQVAIVYNQRIWFIEQTAASGSQGWISSIALDGTDYVKHFDSTDGPGDLVEPFTGGDGWYYN